MKEHRLRIVATNNERGQGLRCHPANRTLIAVPRDSDLLDVGVNGEMIVGAKDELAGLMVRFRAIVIHGQRTGALPVGETLERLDALAQRLQEFREEIVSQQKSTEGGI